MTTTLLQPQKLPPANDGHVRDNLTADERLLKQAVARCLKAQVAEVHGKVEGGAKSNAVPAKTTKWDQEVMREVRPIWFGLFKKGGDKALQNIRRFPKHARKMAVLSWAEMQASERVEVVEKGYNPDQPRVPAGSPEGGQFGDGSGSGSGGSTVSAEEFATFYHGTITEAMDDILSDGLDAGGTFGGNFDPSYSMGQRGGKVFVADSFARAKQYGIEVMNRKESDGFAVLTIDIPKGELAKLEKDPFSPDSYMFPKHIPSEWIVDHEIFNQDDADDEKAFKPGKVFAVVFAKQIGKKSLKATPSIVIPEWIEDPDVLDALEKEMFKFAHGINQTTADDLRAELLAGVENGETIGQLADRISGLSDEWVEGWRSEMIARTETARAFSTGHIEAWKSTGVVSRKVWVAAGDACPFCQQMDGTVVELDENFFDQGEEQTTDWKGQEVVMGHDYSDVNGPPLHPNCRCVLVAELDEEKMVRKNMKVTNNGDQ